MKDKNAYLEAENKAYVREYEARNESDSKELAAVDECTEMKIAIAELYMALRRANTDGNAKAVHDMP